jgi:CBS-domain-containing membrane protein
MRRSVVIAQYSDSLEQAAKLMLRHNLRGLPVVDAEGKICGFISVSDYRAKDIRFLFSRYCSSQLFEKWVPSVHLKNC